MIEVLLELGSYFYFYFHTNHMILTKLTGKIWGNANVTKKDEMKKIPGVTSSDRVKKCQHKIKKGCTTLPRLQNYQ